MRENHLIGAASTKKAILKSDLALLLWISIRAAIKEGIKNMKTLAIKFLFFPLINKFAVSQPHRAKVPNAFPRRMMIKYRFLGLRGTSHQFIYSCNLLL